LERERRDQTRVVKAMEGESVMFGGILMGMLIGFVLGAWYGSTEGRRSRQ
jgi:F0F1-type ATP synthase assembly protein I